MSALRQALIVIDIQNDYFESGKFPLWNADQTLLNIEKVVKSAQAKNIPVILVQHISSAPKGSAAFFEADSHGADIHPTLKALAPDAPVVVKRFADSFHQTTLQSILDGEGIQELLVCGMMTQNCVTHTAISKNADAYSVKVLADCSTTVTEMIHKIALSALTTRVSVVTADQVF